MRLRLTNTLMLAGIITLVFLSGLMLGVRFHTHELMTSSAATPEHSSLTPVMPRRLPGSATLRGGTRSPPLSQQAGTPARDLPAATNLRQTGKPVSGLTPSPLPAERQTATGRTADAVRRPPAADGAGAVSPASRPSAGGDGDRPTGSTTGFLFSGSDYLQGQSSADGESMTYRVWLKLSGDNREARIKTIVSNRYSGCAASAERHGFALFVNVWNTAQRALVLNWGNSQTGCRELASPPSAIPYDQWVHVAFVLSPSVIALYVNGARVASKNQPVRVHQTRLPLHVGAHADLQHAMIGRMTELRVWKTALTDAQIAADFSGNTPADTSLRWRLLSTTQQERDEVMGRLLEKKQLAVPAPLSLSSSTRSSARATSAMAAAAASSQADAAAPLLTGLPAGEPTAEELAESDRLGRERAAAVKEAFQHDWRNYKAHAWGRDELLPRSGRGKDNWGGFGVTLVDSLDTMWIMGMRDEFDAAKRWVSDSLSFNKRNHVSFFETTIRELGGLLSAYDLSKDTVFLQAAKDLGNRLAVAFNTESGIPVARIGLSASGKQRGSSTVLAELGTVQVEFRYLAHATGEKRFADLANKVYTVLERNNRPNGLFPIHVSTASGRFTSQRVTFGALGDSFYEYLLKCWIQGGKKEDNLLRMYKESMDGVFALLHQRSKPSGLSYIADWNGRNLVHKMDHLACFLGGVLALGAKTIPNYANADRDMELAKALTYTCVQLYTRQATGIAPEYVQFTAGQDFVPAPNAPFYILRPETVESLFVLHQLTGHPQYREWGWKIFQAIEKHCRLRYGHGAYPDVRKTGLTPDDRMESFWLGETLKYLYLLLNPDHDVRLDKVVFNTEAHPMSVFQ